MQDRRPVDEVRVTVGGGVSAGDVPITELVADVGALLPRTKTCGKPSCRFMKDPKARHGPYYEWTRMKDGRLVHNTSSPEQAALMERAISNYRMVQELLRRWHDESEADILETAQIEVPKSREKP